MESIIPPRAIWKGAVFVSSVSGGKVKGHTELYSYGKVQYEDG